MCGGWTPWAWTAARMCSPSLLRRSSPNCSATSVKKLIRVASGTAVGVCSQAKSLLRMWSNSFNAVAASLFLTHTSISSVQGSTPCFCVGSITRAPSVDCPVFSASSRPSKVPSHSAGTCASVELREAYRGAFSACRGSSGWGPAIWSACLAPHSTAGSAGCGSAACGPAGCVSAGCGAAGCGAAGGGAAGCGSAGGGCAGLGSAAGFDCEGAATGPAPLASANLLAACLALCSPSRVIPLAWTGFFAGAASFFAGAALACAFLCPAFTEPATKAPTDRTTANRVFCTCASESWLRQEISKSAPTHTAAKTAAVYT
mmetsp:Transcript_29497/g.84240  ORF Transcript_29497/g.84240 Transcript_29497/m.84240 type:complete len:316 (+) Transcript_29497:914-1861(+)